MLVLCNARQGHGNLGRCQQVYLGLQRLYVLAFLVLRAKVPISDPLHTYADVNSIALANIGWKYVRLHQHEFTKERLP